MRIALHAGLLPLPSIGCKNVDGPGDLEGNLGNSPPTKAHAEAGPARKNSHYYEWDSPRIENLENFESHGVGHYEDVSFIEPHATPA